MIPNKRSNSSGWPIYGILVVTTTPGHSGAESNEMVLHIVQNPKLETPHLMQFIVLQTTLCINKKLLLLQFF